MNSFYGGPNGAPFKISKIFDTIYYNESGTREKSLIHDLEKRWQSEIGVDEYVFVSYGLPSNADSYIGKADIDYNASQKNFNGTLWQKVYKEADQTELINTTTESSAEAEYPAFIFNNNSNLGWGYKFIASFAGQTPYLTSQSENVEASEGFFAEIITDSKIIDGASVDRPVLRINEPYAWDHLFEIKNSAFSDGENLNVAEIKTTYRKNDNTLVNNKELPHSKKVVTLTIPNPPAFTAETIVSGDIIEAGTAIASEINETGSGYKLKIPVYNGADFQIYATLKYNYTDDEAKYETWNDYWTYLIADNGVLSKFANIKYNQVIMISYDNTSNTEEQIHVSGWAYKTLKDSSWQFLQIQGGGGGLVGLLQQYSADEAKINYNTYTAKYINALENRIAQLESTWSVYSDALGNVVWINSTPDDPNNKEALKFGDNVVVASDDGQGNVVLTYPVVE